MRRAGRVLAAALLAIGGAPLNAQTRVLDDFESTSHWSPHPSDGVSLAIASDGGRTGRAMRLDIDYRGGGGYAIARRALPLDLPANYEFSFWVRGTLPPENLEFKMVDSSGDNVWWVNRRDFAFGANWTKVTIRKRHVSFAWGPAGGGEMRRMAALEIAITAGSGGRGSVWLDDLMFETLPPVAPYRRTPAVIASSARPGFAATRAMDGRRETLWRSTPADTQSLTIDFGQQREIGGLTVDWDSVDYASDYDVLTSADGARWDSVYAVRWASGGRHYLYLPETETRYLRLHSFWGRRGRGVAIREISVKPLEWAATPNAFFAAVAADAPRGRFPRYLRGAQSYWMVVGVPGDRHEGLLSEDGMLETGKASFSIEPFLFANGRLHGWSDVTITQSLEEARLPIPTVRWRGAPFALDVTAFASGKPGAAMLHGRYRVTNRSRERRRGVLYLAIRPFQVNPSWQFLNTTGGFARIDRIAFDGRIVTVNGERIVVPITVPIGGFGGGSLEHGEVTSWLRRGKLPERTDAVDSRGFASGALAYALDLAPGATREIDIVIPFERDGSARELALRDDSVAARLTAASMDSVVGAWREALDRVRIELPPAAMPISRAVASNLAWILINRDGPAIQPGSRSYERSWIRDGALTSAALLRLGHEREVREFIEWYAPFQYPSGKVPCCVDARGADPVPEHDSHGELIYVIAEYFRFTGDTAFVARMWPHVRGAVAYIDSLRAQRMSDEYRTPEKRAYFGLVPQSISHEGYSAKPMHSFWDDLFTLRGLKDAAMLAGVLGKADTAAAFAGKRDEFRRHVIDAYLATMRLHRIGWLAGAVELGDFDATSTTIAVSPGGEEDSLPRKPLEVTFRKYLENFRARRASSTWDAYTPYEWRTVGTFVRLGQREAAHEILRWFMPHRRPLAWNHWAEVVWRDVRAPKFIGDMPHTWVGSDFIRSVSDLFAYEKESDSTLVIGAGVPRSWVTEAPGVAVRGLRTHYGPLDLTMRGTAARVSVTVGGGLRVPPGGIVLASPFARPATRATVNGEPAAVTTGGVVLRRVPADVILHY